jgi:UDP-GlcNAc:undecaprenyl-phosphate GlcNAc-1-phosphate transferase
MWRLEIPLFHGKLAVGRLFICGTNREDAACTWMGDIVDGLRPFEQQMRDLLDATAVDRTPESPSAPRKMAV